ncbi:MAG: carbohydrate binding family 9 domain-containing protein [Betaproteobacteria bacterium]|nr:carbohydrate binding family 9 domain-containing protein [Betaproteobacteria bacterium]
MQSIVLRRAGAAGAFVLVLWAAAHGAWAQTNSAPVAPAATTAAYQLGHAPARAIRVDGKLDEDAWRAAPVIDHFSENLPLARSTSRHRTELRMLVSGHDLHVGMKSYDEDPDAIRAPLVRRDGVLGDQDFFALYLDSVGTRTFGQFFRINARGVLSDGSWNDQIGLEDFSPDFEYEGAAARFDDATGRGWSAEMRIPLTSLRMPDPPPKEWTFIFFNSWTRDTRYRVANVPLPRDWSCMLCIAQPITLPPDMPHATGWSVTPQATFSRQKDRDAGAPSATDRRIRAGVDAKWRITGDTIIDATFNPDFSQIEIDAPQLAANTQFALFFPEKRPFFLEGADLFDMPLRAVYTRSFTDPKWGTRITRRAAQRDFTLLAAHDEGGGFTLLPGAYATSFAEQRGADTLLARGRQHYDGFTLGEVATWRRDDQGRTNIVAGGDTVVRLDNDSRLRAQALGSYTRDRDWRPGAVSGSAASVEYAHLGPAWEVNVGGEALNANFRADQGFIAQNDYHRASANVARKWQDFGSWSEAAVFVNAEHKRTPAGATLLNALRLGAFGNTARNTWLTVEPRYEEVRVTERGALHPVRYVHLHIESTPFPWLSYLAWDIDTGERVDVANDRVGRGTAITGTTRMRFFERTELDLRSNWQWVAASTPAGRRRVLTERTLQATGVFHIDARNNVRIIAQDGSTSRNPALYADTAVSAKIRNRVFSLVYAFRAGLQMSVYVGASTARDRDTDGGVDRRVQEAFVKVAYTFLG